MANRKVFIYCNWDCFLNCLFVLQAAQRQIRQLVNRSQLTNLRRPPPPGGLPPNQRQVQAN